MLLAAVLASGMLAIAAGCSLSWEVRPDPSDGSVAPESSVPDVSVPDTGVDASEDAPAEAESDAACTTPSAVLAAKRKAARTCTLATADCKSMSVKDECDCDVPVRSTSSAETAAYSAAVADWVAACGKGLCAGCPTITAPATWACLQPDGTIHCTP